MVNQQFSFTHCVEVPRCDCLMATARDERGRTKIYLIFNHLGPVYRRNALQENWEKLDGDDYYAVRELFSQAVDRNIPRYSTAGGRSIVLN